LHNIFVESNFKNGIFTDMSNTNDNHYSNLVSGFERQVLRHPDHTAVRYENQSYSYAEMNAQANRIARWLLSLNVQPEQLIGICLERTALLPAAILGVLKAGCAYVPIDLAYPSERIAYILNDADVQIMLTEQSLLAQLPSGDNFTALALDASESPLTTFSDKNPGIIIQPHQLAYVLYTSGSTGNPKGVMISHHNVTRLFSATDHWFGFNENDVWTMFHSFAFDFSVWEMWGALLYGGCVVVVPYHLTRSPEAFLKLLVSEKVTVLNQTPSAFQQLIAADRQFSNPADLALRYVIFGGEKLHFQMLQPWMDRYGDLNPQLINMYGITETTVHVTYRPVTKADLQQDNGSLIGQPIPDLEILLLDDHLQPVPDGQPGEICVAGDGVARGYWKRETLTAERFVPHPTDPQRGKIYRSGDLARRLPNGDLEYLGRKDFQVKIRGFRIELGEIEARLLQHPQITAAVVLAKAHPVSGEQRLVAYLVTAAPVNVSDLREFLGKTLPDYMIPSAFVMLDALPLTANGKVDRAALPEPAKSRPNLNTPYLAPRNRTERYLCNIWQEVLGIEQIGIRDAFFELGGTSLQAGQFVARLYRDLGEEVFVVTLFEKPTIEQFAAMLEKEYQSALKRYFDGDKPAPAKQQNAERHIITPETIRQMHDIIPTVTLRSDPHASPNPPAMFILAPPRSGTTLFRTMLAGHPGLFAASELQLLMFNDLLERRNAFSGKWQVWLEGTIRAIMEIKKVDADTARAMMAEFEEQKMTTKAFYRQLQSWLNGRMLVDKTPQYALDLQCLYKAEREFENARYVHLIRHPYAAIRSFESVHMHQIMYLKEHHFPELLLGELIWLVSHQNIMKFLDTVPQERKLAIWYEDLVRNPEQTVQNMCRHFGIDYHPDMANPYKDMHKRMVDGIYKDSRPMGDLRMLAQQKVNPKLADRWRGVLTDNFLSEQTWDIASRLGYERDLTKGTLFSTGTFGSSKPAPSDAVDEVSDVAPNDIAIIGMAGRFPGADSVAELWEKLCRGEETIRRYSDEELLAAGIPPETLQSPNYVKAGGTLHNPEYFDAEFFGYLQREAALTDPQQRIFLEAAYSALEDAGCDASRFNGKIGVFAGVGRNAYLIQHIAAHPELRRETDEYHMVISYDKDFSATRVAYKLNLKGPALTVQSACSTSAVAIHLACQSLIVGDSDVALAGGCRVMIPPRGGYEFTEGGPLSPDGHIRTFDADANGMVRTSGTAVLVLKRLKDALKDGDRIYAVIKGSAVNNDGSDKVGFTAPSVSGQSEVVREALQRAGVSPDTVGFVEAHGTGTILGDPIEVQALTRAYRQFTDKTGYCAIGSVKTNIGHLDAGAGAVATIKAALALKHGIIPPTLHFRKPNPQLQLEKSPFYVNTKSIPFPNPAGGVPRRAAVNAVGLGGTNAHIILEEPPHQQTIPSSKKWHILPISAKTETALHTMADRLGEALRNLPEAELADAAFTLQTGRPQYAHRAVTVAATPADAAEILKSKSPQRYFAMHTGGEPHSIVFMFAGGGAQHLQMGQGLYENEPVFRHAVDECAAILQPLINADIRQWIYPPQSDNENQDRLHQPLPALVTLFTMQYACAKLWQHWEIRPDAMIGHSMGEYTAACLAGVFSLEDALKMVVKRGQLFETLTNGAMLSVPLSEAALRKYLNDDLAIAAINHPESCVASGSVAAIENLQRTLETEDIEATRVRINVAAHSHLIEPILSEFHRFLQQIEFHESKIPLISNLSGQWADASIATPDYWVQHLRHTVRFADGLSTLLATPGRVFLEIGPGQILASLTRMHPQKDHAAAVLASMRHPRDTQADDQVLYTALGRLWLCGCNINWKAFWGDEKRLKTSLPTYPFERKRYWIDPPNTAAEVPAVQPSLNFSGESPMQPETATTPPVATVKSRAERIADKLKQILHDLSGVAIESLNPDITFLELGFDSLFLSQANANIQRTFKVKISFRQLFEEAPTISMLAAYIDQKLPADAFPPDPAEVPAPAPAANVQADIQPASTVPMGSPDGNVVERVIYQQLQTMQQLMTRQLQMLQQKPGTAGKPMPSPQAASPQAKPKAAPQHITSLDAQQSVFLNEFIARYCEKTRTSKAIAAEQRRYLADPQVIDGFHRFWKEVVYPITAKRSEGARIIDVDGNEYIDMIMGFGVNLFGHQPPFIVEAIQQQIAAGMHLGVLSPLAKEVARLICEMTGHERVHIVNTGSEAVLAAVRAARTVTGRHKIAVFEGDYHGLVDEFLVRGINAGGEKRTLPRAPGIPEFLTENTIILEYNDSCIDTIRAHADELAAVIIEPVTAVQPNFQPGDIIKKVREVTRELDIALIFDELITGFRLHPKGAQGWYGVEADICSYGKAISGSMPMAAVAGKARYMDAFDGGEWQYGDDSYPEGVVTYCVGTYMRNPVGLAAAHASLRYLQALSPALQKQLNKKAERFAAAANAMFKRKNAPVQILNGGSIIKFIFTDGNPLNGLFFFLVREKGVLLRERACFISTAHTDDDLQKVLQALEASVEEMQQNGWMSGGESQAKPLRLPITDQQMEIWLATQMSDEAACAYNMSTTIVMDGKLDTAALHSAIEALVERHEALRITFDAYGQYQQINRHIDVPLKTVDWSHLPEADREAELQQLQTAENRQPFDFVNGPLIRFTLVKLTDTRHALLLTAHHLICDGWSMGLLCEDLGKLYAAAEAGKPLPAEENPRFSEFVQSAIAFWQTEDGKMVENYWLNRFQQPPQPLRLPYDFPSSDKRSYRSGQLFAEIDAATFETLRNRAKAMGATAFSLLMSGFLAILHHLSGQTDIAVGLAAAGQTAPGNNRLVGHCVSLLPIRTTIEATKPFKTLLGNVKEALMDAFDHREFTYGKLLEKLNISRNSSHPPLLSVEMTYESETDALPFGSLQAVTRLNPKSFANFDLELYLTETGNGLRIRLDYQAEKFAETTVREWLNAYIELLKMVAAAPEKTLQELLSAFPKPAYQQHLSQTPEKPKESVAAAPTTDTEKALCEIFRSVIKINDIGIHDDFYDLGGHSLLAVQILSRIREQFGIELPLRAILVEMPTVAALAAHIDNLKLIAAPEKPTTEADDANDWEDFEL
jgi:amino acid adenylation domain-containing protein